jgi:hypothetical protein
MILTPDEARDYLRAIPEEFDDDTALGYIAASETYLTNAGCVLNADDELAKLAVKMLVVMHYENRDPASRSTDKLDVGLKSIITQLQLIDPVGDTL